MLRAFVLFLFYFFVIYLFSEQSQLRLAIAHSPIKANSLCLHCNKQFHDEDKFLKCDMCEKYIHGNCTGLNATSLKKIIEIRSNVYWCCAVCKGKDPI